jgi:lipoprotein-anchoring transpeptidase ErfK/SrfK
VNRGLKGALLVLIGTLGTGVIAGQALASRPAQVGKVAHAGKPHQVAKHSHQAPARVRKNPYAVPAGVRIAGVRVGGLAPAAAAAAVRAAFAKPLPVRVDGTKVELYPSRLAKAYVLPAVGHARSSKAGTNVKLVVAVRGIALRATAATLAKRFDRAAKDAHLTLVRGRPRITAEVDGLALDKNDLIQRVSRALTGNVRLPVSVHPESVNPVVTARSYGSVILIDRAHNRLYLFRQDNKLWREFPVATGQAIYPTPAGRFDIVVKQVDPWWYPPTQDAWAAGLSAVPPGPSNPLGTRWMGLSAPGIGIHGTDEPSSIGWNASHGCIRMQVADAEWLYSHVTIGTTVFIV